MVAWLARGLGRCKRLGIRGLALALWLVLELVQDRALALVLEPAQARALALEWEPGLAWF